MAERPLDEEAQDERRAYPNLTDDSINSSVTPTTPRPGGCTRVFGDLFVIHTSNGRFPGEKSDLMLKLREAPGKTPGKGKAESAEKKTAGIPPNVFADS